MTVKQEYQKLRRSLQRQIRELEKRGYFFPAGSPLPETPKKITRASVRRLEKIKSELYKKARWKDPITGNETSGVRGRDIENERRARKSAETRKRNGGGDGGGGEPPVYTMYERIRQELQSRKIDVYTRKYFGSRSQVITVYFRDAADECISILDANFIKDPEGYETYLSAMEPEIFGALEKSEIIADFMSDISEIEKGYQELKNLLNGSPVDAAGDIPVDDEGFMVMPEGGFDLPFD